MESQGKLAQVAGSRSDWADAKREVGHIFAITASKSTG
jgi:hypothetical protein